MVEMMNKIIIAYVVNCLSICVDVVGNSLNGGNWCHKMWVYLVQAENSGTWNEYQLCETARMGTGMRLKVELWLLLFKCRWRSYLGNGWWITGLGFQDMGGEGSIQLET